MIKSFFGIIIVALVVLGAIIYGFSSSGSPAQVRAIKFDSQRLQDINVLKSYIEGYYKINQHLPGNLEEAQQITSSYARDYPSDPETKKSYDYIPGSGVNYKLCATFSRSNMDEEQRRSNNFAIYGNNFSHPKGYHCFDMSIPQTKLPRPTGTQLYPTPTTFRYMTPTLTPPPGSSNR